jgi:prephenate dehydrogenase
MTVEQPPTSFPTGLSSFVILGANGQVARLLAKKLSETGATVTAIDLHPAAIEEGQYAAYCSSNVASPDDRALTAIQQAACIIVCLPESVALAALPHLMKGVSRGALLVDTLSVKANYITQLRTAGKQIECLSINPMFSPSLDFNGQNVAVIEVIPGPLAQEFVNLLTNWKANVMTVTLEEHDEITAFTQVATHAALIVFGSVLSKLGYDIETASRLATPPHRLLMSLLARISVANPEVYWEIQHSNPIAAKIRHAMAESIEELNQKSSADNPEEFARLMEAIRTTLGPAADELAETCAAVFQHDRLSPKTSDDHD